MNQPIQLLIEVDEEMDTIPCILSRCPCVVIGSEECHVHATSLAISNDVAIGMLQICLISSLEFNCMEHKTDNKD